MADAQRTIDLIFNGVDKTGAATQAALGNTQKFASGLQTATQPIADFSIGALKLEAGLLAAGAAVTAFSVKVASEFQAGAADLQKVLSDTESIETYRDLALELSDAYGVSAAEVLQAITSYKQAGFTAEEAGQLTKSGLDLVIAGSVDAARGADLLVASIKGFGTEASTSATIVDLLNSVSNEYAATTSQLLEGFSVLSPVAKAAGLSLQETIGILTPGIEVFQSGSEVASALRTSLLRLVDDSAPVQEGLEQLGVSQKDANGELRSARDIYFDVAAALQGADQNQKLYIASQLVGIQRSSQFLAITDGLDKTLRIAGDGFEFVGSAAKEVELQLATASVAGERAKQAFTNLFINIGTPLLEESTGISNAITKIFQALGQSAVTDSGIGEVVGFIEGELAGLQETLETVARNLPEALEGADLSGFADGVSAVSSAIRTLFGEIDLTTVEGLTAAIELAGDAFNGLSQFTGGVIESFRPLFEQIAGVAGGLGDINPELFKTAGSIAGFATQANILSGALVDVIPALEALLGILILRQGGGLLAAVASVSSSLGGGTGLLARLGQLAALGGAGAAGFGLGTALNELSAFGGDTRFSDRLSQWVGEITGLNDELDALGDKLNDDTAPSAAAAAKSIADADREMSALAGTAKSSGQSVFNFSTGLSDLGDAADRLPQSSLNEFFEEGVGELIPYTDAIDQASDSTKKLSRETRDSAGTFSVVSTEANKAAKSVLDLANAGSEIQLEFAIARLESQTAIATASIEANAQKTVAAFESIGTSVDSTGTSLNELFGLLGDDTVSKFDKLGIKEQIEIENERREEALRLQKRLTEEQIKEARARREALQAGQGLITVNGDGLAPHLEAFMFEILEAIQIRANQEGAELLLGLS